MRRWGQSVLSTTYNNFFGITAYGKHNAYWTGDGVVIGIRKLKFRLYAEPLLSFLDYARLIRTGYKRAAALSYDIAAFAREISQSPYISEVNGDDREAYQRMLIAICNSLSSFPPTGQDLSPRPPLLIFALSKSVDNFVVVK
jgi:flagellar protein FlgJ